jgi:hypothetical protein
MSADKSLGEWVYAYMLFVSLGSMIVIISNRLNYGVENFGLMLIIIGIICGFIGILNDKIHKQ